MRGDKKTLRAEPEARPLEVLLSLPLDAILNPEEARIYARLKSRQAIYNWLNDPNDPLPASKKGGWKIIKQELDAYIRRKYNRRSSDSEGAGSESNESLRNLIALLIEVAQGAIAWKRATVIYQAASNSALTPGGTKPDLEWITKTFDDTTTARERLSALTNNLSEEQLITLRFMLPSISSALAISGTSANDGDGQARGAQLARTS